MISLVGKYRGLSVVIIPCYDQSPAEFRSALNIGLPEYVGAAINAMTFTVPIAEYTLFTTGSMVMVSLLGSPKRRRGEIFVDTGLERHIMLL